MGLSYQFILTLLLSDAFDISEGAHSKLYFDLEFNTKHNKDINGLEMTSVLIDIVNRELSKYFGIKNTIKDVLILDSSYQGKFSSHLIFFKTVFKDNSECKKFVNLLINSLTDSEKSLFTIKAKNGERLFIDTSGMK